MVKITDTDQRMVVQRLYEYNLETLRFTSHVHGEYGRWLLATVAAVHFGAIYLTSSMDDLVLSAKLLAIWVFVAGLVLILLSGLAAWANWGALRGVYQRWNDASMLVDTDYFPKSQRSLWIPITYWSAIVLGIASAICLPVGAYLATVPLLAQPT